MKVTLLLIYEKKKKGGGSIWNIHADDQDILKIKPFFY